MRKKTFMALTEDDLQAISGIVQSQVEPLRQDMAELKEDVKGTGRYLELRVGRLEETVSGLKENVKLKLENQIVLQLNEIQVCYTSTFNRYQRDADWMENAKIEFEVMQQTVKEHSAKLQKLEKVV